jgi:bis(5'-nucleosidyl)-tetraphosphatase
MILLIIILFLLLVFVARYFIIAGKPSYAGGIVYRIDGNTKKYLLVKAKNNKHRWVLPKGHIEKGETEEQAAMREVKEEAGVEATLERKLGNALQIKNFIHPINISFYLLQYSGEVPSKENRSCKWLPLDDAINHASIPSQKKVLKQLS